MATLSDVVRAREDKDEIALLLRLGQSIVTELDLDKNLCLAAELARELIQAETLIVPILTPDRRAYIYRSASGKDADLIRGQRFNADVGMCGWVLSTQQPLIFGLGHEWLMGTRTRWEHGMKSALLVPLISRGRIIGGLSGLGKLNGESFTQRDLELLTVFAHQTAIAVDNAHIVHALKQEKDRIQATLHSIADGVIITDNEGRVESINSAATRLLGLDIAAVRGTATADLFELFDATGQPLTHTPIERCLHERKVVRSEEHITLSGHNGISFAAELSAAPVEYADGHSLGSVVVIRDVRQARAMEQELVHHASHDQLTGLLNRREFEHLLNQTLASVQEGSGEEHVLGYLDLDQFKLVNDTSGHIAGDELLRQVGTVLREHVRGHDVLARLGGDEFGLILRGCSPEKGVELAEKLRAVLEEFRFAWAGQPFSISVSIGLAPITSEETRVDKLMSAADAACYAAKDGGRNRIRLYHASDDELQSTQSVMEWTARIHRALDENRFVLYGQEIRPSGCSDTHDRHCEILLRLQDTDGHLYSPGSFMPAAERYGLMRSIDRWVIQNTFAWLQSGGLRTAIQRYSINLSGQSLGSGELLPFIQRMTQQYAIPLERICFEITESAAIANLQHANNLISELHAAGCAFALDDFGNGMSSFAYLKNLPVDYLKIDGIFVKDMVNDPVDAAMVRSINEIGKLMGKQTVAEFVENGAILDMLCDIGIDYVQGYFIGMPHPLVQ